jgi:uncharacterized membrane protein
MAALFNDDIVIVGLILSLPGLAFYLSKHYKWAHVISAPGLCYLFGIMLSNLHITPPKSPIYEIISTYTVYLALPMILFSVNIKSWIKIAKTSLISFVSACFFVFIVSIITGLLFAVKVDNTHGWKVVGMLVGTYTGGSMNLAAVGKGLNTPGDLFVAVNAVDIVLYSVFLPLQLLLISFLNKWGFKDFNVLEYEENNKDETLHLLHKKIKEEGYWHKKSWSLYDFIYIISISAFIIAISFILSHLFNFGIWTGTVNILLLTTFGLIAANIYKVRSLVGNEEVSMYLLHTFFVAIGSSAFMPTILKQSPILIIWVAIAIYGSAFLHYLVAGKILKIDHQTIQVTAQAAIGGPSTALALAISANWPFLTITAVITGLIGYGVGNYLGFGAAFIVYSILF